MNNCRLRSSFYCVTLLANLLFYGKSAHAGGCFSFPEWSKRGIVTDSDGFDPGYLVSLTTSASIKYRVYRAYIVRLEGGEEYPDIRIIPNKSDRSAGSFCDSDFLLKPLFHLDPKRLTSNQFYFWGMDGDKLILDVGTASGCRGVVAYDVEKGTKIWTGVYDHEFKNVSRGLWVYWGCDSYSSQQHCFCQIDGVGPASYPGGIEKLMLIDLNSATTTNLGVTRCTYNGPG
jgi:hypothetical protein